MSSRGCMVSMYLESVENRDAMGRGGNDAWYLSIGVALGSGV